MEIIGTDLVELVNQSFNVTPQHFEKSVRDDILNNIELGSIAVSTSSPETTMLAKLMARYLPLITESAVEKLGNCNVVLVPIPVCNATAKTKKGESYIAIFDGLLDVAISQIEMSYIVQCLPEELDAIFPREDFPTVSVKSWLAVIFSSFIRRFITHGEPLPNFRAISPSLSIDTEVEHAFLGTAWWVILHELGHIELGHTRFVNGGARPSICEELIVSEIISEFQKQEFEADQFVYSCLTDEAKKAFYAWTNHALGTSLMIETVMASERGTHPLTINRLNNALAITKGMDEISKEVSSREYLNRHGEAHKNIHKEHQSIREQGQSPVFEKFSRNDLFTVISGLRGVLYENGIDIDPFLNSNSMGWREVFKQQ